MEVQGDSVDGSVSPREAARMLGIRLDAVYGLIWAGRLQAEKHDGRWHVSESAVEARMNSNARRRI